MDERQIIPLVRKAQQGDRHAFNDLVRHFEPTVFAIVLRRLRNRSEAREVTQDVFVQVLRKIGQLRDAARFAGWLRQIAVRRAINRAVRRPHEASCSDALFDSVKNESHTPLDDLMRHEDARQLRGGLKRLREMDRRTLMAFYFEGQSLKQMSDRFERPIGTIKRRLHTARTRLRQQLVDMQPV